MLDCHFGRLGRAVEKRTCLWRGVVLVFFLLARCLDVASFDVCLAQLFRPVALRVICIDFLGSRRLLPLRLLDDLGVGQPILRHDVLLGHPRLLGQLIFRRHRSLVLVVVVVRIVTVFALGHYFNS